MTDASDNPDQTEVLRLTNLAQQSRIWTALPGIVESYDAKTQRAEIKPSLAGFRILTEGEEVEELSNIPNVPVVMPSGGGFFCSFPLKKGDPVVLVFACRDIGPWKAGEGQPVDAQDNRMHDLTDAFAFPGGRAEGNVIAEADADKLIIAKDGGKQIRLDGKSIDLGVASGEDAAAAMARADKVDDRLELIETWAAQVQTLTNDHDHLDGEGQPTSKMGTNASGTADTPIPPLPVLLPVGCDNVNGT